MNRSLGVSTGAVLLLGVILRTGTAPAPAREASPPRRPAPVSADSASGRTAFEKTGKKSTGEGPWIASCRYWETSTGLRYPAKVEKAGKVSLEFKGDNGKIEARVKASEGESSSECESNGDAWGIPSPSASAKAREGNKTAPRVEPEITAVLAAVPDPLHTHLALEFDRDIDALLQAGAENGFLVSQYWLPWRSPEQSQDQGQQPAGAAPAADSGESRQRERQPGLIVLKYAPEDNAPSADRWKSYDRVIYLFLVGESPASGMNGAQLRNALRYEAMLKTGYPSAKVSLSMRGGDDLAVIGSPNSGSAVSLREAIEAASGSLHVTSVHMAGSTQTAQANHALQMAFPASGMTVHYLSFGEDFEYEEHKTLDLLSNSGFDTGRVAILVEENTVFGNSGTNGPTGYRSESGNKGLQPLIVRFPREISLLRNAQTSDNTSSAPTPYLRLTLKDAAANDTVPHFSGEQTPLSQEAVLMSIQRELSAHRAQFLAIQATNELDTIYLANYFHRACPNLQLVFLGGGDLLLEREVDNVPYIGSVTMTPYNLVGLIRTPSDHPASRAFPDSNSEAMYNAASYTFQRQTTVAERVSNPRLASYQGAAEATSRWTAESHASLWATVIGADGYYPLGVAASCASESAQSLPDFVAGQPQACVPKARYPDGSAKRAADYSAESGEMRQFALTATLFPCLLWTVLSVVLGLYCACHGAVVLAADFWSPFTRDLAIGANDQPARRSVYMNIGTVMLFAMVFVLEWPVFCVGPVLKVNLASLVTAVTVLICGVFAVVATLCKTMPYSFPALGWKGWHTCNSYQAACCFFNLVALLALIFIPGTWRHLCELDAFGDLHTNYGVFFSIRCLHPDSQVSPVVPVLLVLLAWFLWAYCQTFRLRFSKAGRPRLPGTAPSGGPLPLSVTDVQMAACSSRRDASLYTNITCLLITRELLVRFLPKLKTIVSAALAVFYVLFFLVLMHFGSIKSVDRMVLDTRNRPTCYEALLVALTGPLLVIGLAGWLRMMLVWGSLRRGLLERLEMYPLRGAFTRLKGIGWMTMMRDTGLHQRWRDMARSNESIRQLVNNQAMQSAVAIDGSSSSAKFQQTFAHLQGLVTDATAESRGEQIIEPTARTPLQNAYSAEPKDLPDKENIVGLEIIAAIEDDFAAICEILLRTVLIPYWTAGRSGFVEGESLEAVPIHGKRSPASDQPHGPIELHAGASSGDPEYIRLAEELLALRYLSLIRAVLGNVRYLMTFVSAAFVLSLVAWNSYPFQPKELVDWAFTFAFLVLFGGIIWVFAQMHRNALLSRITDTSPNELGFDFYWRLITFGAIPLLTWLSYQFPQAWSGIFRMVQPSLSAMK